MIWNEGRGKKMSTLYGKWIKKAIVTVIISFFIEIVLSNYNMVGCLQEPHNQIVDNVHIYTDEEGGAACEIEQIEFAVKNITIQYRENTKELVNYTVRVDQYGQEGWAVEYPEKWDTVRGSTRICTNCVMTVHSLEIEGNFKPENIERIILNSTGIQFNVSRFVLLALLGFFIIYLKSSFSTLFSMRWKTIVLLTTAVNLLMIMFAVTEMGDSLCVTAGPEEQDMNLVVEALEAHRVSFDVQPPDELIAMDNPYDYSLRATMGFPYLFDASFYKGNYYTYFGITPVLLLMLPFHLLTGRYLHTYAANLIFMVVFVYLTGIIYHLFIKRYVHKISRGAYIVGYITLIIGSGSLSLLRGKKYDIALSCALDCVMASLIILYNLLEDNRWNRLKLFVCGGISGLIVLAKPNFIVYYIAIGFLLYKYLRNFSRREILKKVMWFAFPLGVCAVFQMGYNYLRFDNIFEFGYQYQIGANIQMFNYFSLLKIFKSMVTYLFNAPIVDTGKFPFIVMTFGTTGTGMNTYSVVDKSVGLFFVPILYILCFKREIFQRISTRQENTKEISLTIDIIVGIAALNLFISSITSAVYDEYLIDVRGILILASIVLYCVYMKEGCGGVHPKIFIILCVMTILIMLPLSLNFWSGGADLMLETFNKPNVWLKNLFEFWT